MAPAAVHFTHHLCRTVDPTSDQPDLTWQREHARHPGSRFIVWGPCRRAPSPRARFSTEPAHVTCRWCQRAVARQEDDRAAWLARSPRERGDYSSWPDRGEYVKRAWRLCCSKRGVPSPLSDDDHLQAEIDRLRAESNRVLEFKAAAMTAVLLRFESKNMPSDPGEYLRRELIKLVETLDPTVRELAEPLLQQWMFVGDLFVHVEETLDRVNALTMPFLQAVRASATVQPMEAN